MAEEPEEVDARRDSSELTVHILAVHDQEVIWNSAVKSLTKVPVLGYLVTGMEATGFTIRISAGSHDADVDFSSAS